MLKGRRKNKPVMHPIHDLSVDPMVEDVQRNQETLEEAITENDQGLFDGDNPFSSSENFDDFDFGDESRLHTKSVDPDLPVDPWDPFSTGRGARGDSSDLDRLKSAVDAYIKVSKNHLVMHSSTHLSEAEALRHIIMYWLDRNRDRLIRDFRRLS